VGRFVPIDDVMESRLIGSVRPDNMKWRVDVACRGCGRYGNVVVEFGGELGPKGYPLPRTGDEKFYRDLYAAHHPPGELIGCTYPEEWILRDSVQWGAKIWRWVDAGQGRMRQKVMEFAPDDSEGWDGVRWREAEPPKDWFWPPRRPPWVPR
jgi:hypothetical protein